MERIINEISNICQNEHIIKHVKRLMKEYDDIIELNDRSIRANKDIDVMEINISKNFFTIYSTSWNCTSRNTITFFKLENCIVINFSNSEITNEGIKKNNYQYVFKNNLLECVSYSKKVNLEYELGREVKKIKKEQYIEIYPVNDLLALKKVIKNDNISYFTTHINKVNIKDINLFSFIFSNMNEVITEEEYEKIKVIK